MKPDRIRAYTKTTGVTVIYSAETETALEDLYFLMLKSGNYRTIEFLDCAGASYKYGLKIEAGFVADTAIAKDVAFATPFARKLHEHRFIDKEKT